MHVLTYAFQLPAMRWLADAEEVQQAVMGSPLAERVRVDLDAHLAIAELDTTEAVADVRRRLVAAGYPPAN